MCSNVCGGKGQLVLIYIPGAIEVCYSYMAIGERRPLKTGEIELLNMLASENINVFNFFNSFIKAKGTYNKLHFNSLLANEVEHLSMCLLPINIFFWLSICSHMLFFF